MPDLLTPWIGYLRPRVRQCLSERAQLGWQGCTVSPTLPLFSCATSDWHCLGPRGPLITHSTVFTGCPSQGVPGGQARGRMYPCPCQGHHLVEERRFPPPAVPTKNTRWDPGVPGPNSTLPLLCCVTLGKQLTLSESLISSLEKSRVQTLGSKVPSSQATNSPGSKEGAS